MIGKSPADDSNANDIKILIVAENASAKFGGEAALPLHYFRVLCDRRYDVWLVVHERTRGELQEKFPGHSNKIHYIPDTWAHKSLWAISKRLPDRLAYLTSGFMMRLLTQWSQRQLVKQLVLEHHIDVVHQPTPVSPKEPSMIFGVGAPVIIGPMNGGMNFPPAFKHMQSKGINASLAAGRASSTWLNTLIPGKRLASALLVANSRTRDALPDGINNNIIEVVENGVDMRLWRSFGQSKKTQRDHATTNFVFVGRLIELKGVAYLLRAFHQAALEAPMTLTVIGDGDDRQRLEQLAASLSVLGGPGDAIGKVHFTGWQTQSECAASLQKADALILPSLHECGGAVVLEAMAMGLPVIASNWGGPSDYLDDQCGVLVPVDTIEGFEQHLYLAMLKLADSEHMRRNMGKKAREKVCALFDWEIKVDHMLKIYQDVNRGSHRHEP